MNNPAGADSCKQGVTSVAVMRPSGEMRAGWRSVLCDCLNGFHTEGNSDETGIFDIQMQRAEGASCKRSQRLGIAQRIGGGQ